MPINTKLPETIPPHGGEVYHLARTLGLNCRDLLDFSANINPLGFPPVISEVIPRTLGEIVHYPDRHCLELRQELASYHHLPPDQVLVGNGSTELLYLAARALAPRRALIVAPAFSEYEQALAAARVPVDFQITGEADNFTLTAPPNPRGADLGSGHSDLVLGTIVPWQGMPTPADSNAALVFPPGALKASVDTPENTRRARNLGDVGDHEPLAIECAGHGQWRRGSGPGLGDSRKWAYIIVGDGIPTPSRFCQLRAKDRRRSDGVPVAQHHRALLRSLPGRRNAARGIVLSCQSQSGVDPDIRRPDSCPRGDCYHHPCKYESIL